MRRRATNDEMGERKQVLFEICYRDQPLSVRNAYYQAQTTGIVTKGDAEYRKVQRALLEMRRDGEIPYHWIVDNSRRVRRPRVHSSMEEAIEEAVSFYRRDLWRTANKRVEIWTESDSIAGVITDVAHLWSVSVFPTKGQPSESFVFSAGEYTARDGRPLVVLYLGDLDPAGLEINEQTKGKLRRFAPNVAIDWRRIGVTMEQVDELGLIGKGNRPKKTADWFPYSETFECEAIPAPLLRQMVDDTIREYVDPVHLRVTEVAEESERRGGGRLVDWLKSDPGALARMAGGAR